MRTLLNATHATIMGIKLHWQSRFGLLHNLEAIDMEVAHIIQTEPMTINNHALIRTCSDAGFKIRKSGTDEIYDEAIDPADGGRTYSETNEPVEMPEEDDEAEKHYIEKEASGYDAASIIEEQESFLKMYSKKINKCFKKA